MKIVVASCRAYSDAWPPFFMLFDKYWLARPWPTCLLTDWGQCQLVENVFEHRSPSWCYGLREFIKHYGDEPILLLQEDFFLTDFAHNDLIERALKLMISRRAGMIRLYPCPGADEPIDDMFGVVRPGSRYRISCQASIWNPSYLHKLLSIYDTPREFELQGSAFSCKMSDEVLALRRDAPRPWPIEYLVTAIVRGRWTDAAKELCATNGIEVDWSMRP